MDLKQFFLENSKVALAFSGGVDSSYLLFVAKKYDVNIVPYFVKTAFQPQFELDDAIKMSNFIGIDIKIIELDIFKNLDVIKNDENRCYYCKFNMLKTLQKFAYLDGYSVIIDGTNASDDAFDRKGTKALSELGVLSPLRECGLTKADIRDESKKAGLFTWNKPAYSCLATRITENFYINNVDLLKIENAENILFSLGFSDFRVRLLNGNAKIQIIQEQIPLLIEKRVEILHKLCDFKTVLWDLSLRNSENIEV